MGGDRDGSDSDGFPDAIAQEGDEVEVMEAIVLLLLVLNKIAILLLESVALKGADEAGGSQRVLGLVPVLAET
jgi:hypothetical protein